MRNFFPRIFISLLALILCSVSVAFAAHATYTLLSDTPYATEICINTAPISGPAALVLGGVHGNEPAGSLAAERLCATEVQRGTLIVIPHVNHLALKQNTRTLPEIGDINRAYPGIGDTPAHRIAGSIVEFASRYPVSLVIDLHEARTFHRLDHDSLGQSVLFANNTRSTELAIDLVDAINATLPEPHRKFSLVAHPAPSSAAEYFGSSARIAAFTMETSSKQPIEERVAQHIFLVRALLKQEGLLP